MIIIRVEQKKQRKAKMRPGDKRFRWGSDTSSVEGFLTFLSPARNDSLTPIMTRTDAALGHLARAEKLHLSGDAVVCSRFPHFRLDFSFLSVPRGDVRLHFCYANILSTNSEGHWVSDSHQLNISGLINRHVAVGFNLLSELCYLMSRW